MVNSFLNQFSPIDFDAYINRLTDRFTGRDWLFERHIGPWLKSGEEQFYMLTGEPGVGKSAIVAQLIKRWQNQTNQEEKGKLAAYHFCRAGDVETVRPGRVLRSIAAQLGENLPHYGTALNQVLEPVHLNIDVNINIENLTNSQVTGIYIKNLKNLDPREELRLLIQEPLIALSSIYEDAKTARPRLKIFLIDSLDEAVTTTGRDNVSTLLAALSQTADLPPWIRFILTARPELSALQDFKSIQRYQLEELFEENLEDIEKYTSERLKELVILPELAFQSRLEKAELSTETLTNEIKTLSEGNFLYTRLVIDGISSGELSLNNLSTLPKNLYAVYQRFLRHRCPVRKWVRLYQPILGALTVTQEAAGITQLAKFASFASEQIQSDTQVEEAIAVLKQFLDESENEQGEKLYILFHRSLREYLLDRKHNHDFWCDAKEQHDNIIDFCAQESNSWNELERIDTYGRKHLTQHLVKADQIEKLHMLLNLEKEGKNVWFKLKDDEGDTADFIEDLDLAWLQADSASEREVGKNVGLQCRYALMKASIHSLSEIPKELLVALVKGPNPSWKTAKAFAYARQVPDSRKRCESLTAIAEELSESDPLTPPVLQSAFNAAITIHKEKYRAQALISLTDKLTPELLNNALDAAIALKEEEYQADALIAVANKCVPELLQKVRDTAIAIKSEKYRAKVLIALADNLNSESLHKALEAISMVQGEHAWAQDLIDLSDKLTPELRHKALDKALDIVSMMQNKHVQVAALIPLARKLTPELLHKALDVVSAMQDRDYRAKVLTALTNKYPKLIDSALDAAIAIPDDYAQTRALIALADKLTSGLLDKAFTAASMIQDEYNHALALIALANQHPERLHTALDAAIAIPHEQSYQQADALLTLADKLTTELLNKALDAALAIPDENYRTDVLIALANNLTPELRIKARDAANTIKQKHYRVQVLIALADKRLGVLPEVLDAALAIPDENYRKYRANALIALVDKLPETLPEVLTAVTTINNEEYRADVLIALADKRPEALPEVLDAANTIKKKHWRAQVLIALADKLTPKLLDKALTAASTIQDEEYRAQALIALANQHSELLNQALTTALEIQNEYNQALALIALTNQRPNLLKIAFNAVIEIQNEYAQAQALIELTDQLTPELLNQALIAALAIQDKDAQAQALIALADKLPPELLKKARDNALEIQNEYNRAQILIALADKHPEVLSEVLDATIAIQNEKYRTQALIALADKHPKVLSKVLDATVTIQNEKYRTQALIALADKLPPNLLKKALKSALTIQDGYDQALSRIALLVLANQLTPEDLSKVIDTVLAMKDEKYRTQSLIILADKLPPGLLHKALEVVSTIQDEDYRAKALNALTDKLTPELLKRTLDVALTIQEDRPRAISLVNLCDKLTPELMPIVHASVSTIQDEEYSRHLLINLCNNFPEFLPAGLDAAQAIHDKDDRASALNLLSRQLVLAPNFLTLWQSLLHSLSDRSRPQLFNDLTVLASVIFTFGEEATIETTQAIQDVSRWWP